jgi:Immunity protein 74
MEIIGSTRSGLRISVDGRTISLTGEGMLQGPVDFYADRASIRTWDDGAEVSAADRDRIVRELPGVAARKGFSLVID